MKFAFLENEYWWGGVIHDGRYMPISSEDRYSVDLAYYTAGNQSVPLFISSKGRIIYSEKPFKIIFEKGLIFIEDNGDVELENGGCTLKEAYISAMNKYFPFNGEVPAKDFFVTPQYNTWVELTYNQNQKSVLEYANKVIEKGYAPGVIMIDDTWQLDYGMWQFDCSRFPEPKGMIEELHKLGFKVMLWIAPYISADSPAFREAQCNPDRLLRDEKGNPIIVRWWNGYSAMLDMTKEGDRDWMTAELDRLNKEFGVDGYKFDGGNHGDITRILGAERGIEVSRAWHCFAGDNYILHELKDTWKCSGKPYVQRLRDKAHKWEAEGLSDILPDALNLSITGHPFICPDMIGGGEWTSFIDGAIFDEELIVRYAQCSALFPMMQFSVAPWRILSDENQEYVFRAQKLHTMLGDEIYSLVCDSAKTGEPIMRPLDYSYPDCGYEAVSDQFMLGDNILVAPVIKKGVKGREVYFPDGKWQDENGNIIIGPDKKYIETPLSFLPWYRRG